MGRPLKPRRPFNPWVGYLLGAISCSHPRLINTMTVRLKPGPALCAMPITLEERQLGLLFHLVKPGTEIPVRSTCLVCGARLPPSTICRRKFCFSHGHSHLSGL